MKNSLPFPQPKDPLIGKAEKVLAREGKAIAELVGRPVSHMQDISFRIEPQRDGIAHASGAEITLFKKYCDKYPWDVEGVVVHELAHALQRAPAYHDDFVWMVEGLADFVRYKLGYGTIEPGDPHRSYKIAGGFYNWMYELPDNKQTYRAFIKDLNTGKRPKNLVSLLAEYNCGAAKNAKDNSATPRRNLPPAPKA